MRRLEVAIALSTVLAAVGFGMPPPAAAEVVEIRLTDNLRFDPAGVTVVVNTTVRWRNAGSVSWHTVSAYEDLVPVGAPYFDSGGSPNETAARTSPPEGYLRPGETYEVTFTVPGDHHYFCVPHEGAEMKGVVHVVEALPAPPASDVPLLLAGLAIVVGATGVVYVVARRRNP